MEKTVALKSVKGLLENLPRGWDAPIDAFFQSTTGKTLLKALANRIDEGVTIFPPDPFYGLRLLEPKDVRVVILGQDPYHEIGEATGLAFSVPATRTKLPPSLKNIFKEISRESERNVRANGDLSDWAKAGVLLLNTVLTVEEGRAASHAKLGWETLTDALLTHSLTQQKESPIVFLLWGAKAQEKEELIKEHARGPILILKANHPSPLSALRPPVPFIGCGHFEKANAFLVENGAAAIAWSGPEEGLKF